METETQSERLFAGLCKALSKYPKFSEVVTADLRERTKHTTLPNYHHNGATESEKVELYTLYRDAIVSQNFSKLMGKIANGQAQSGEAQVQPKREIKVTPQVEAMPGMTPLGMKPQPKVEPVIVPSPVEQAEVVVKFPPASPAPASPFDALIEQRIVEILERSVYRTATDAAEIGKGVQTALTDCLYVRQTMKEIITTEVYNILSGAMEKLRTELRKELLVSCQNTRKELIKSFKDALDEMND